MILGIPFLIFHWEHWIKYWEQCSKKDIGNTVPNMILGTLFLMFHWEHWTEYWEQCSEKDIGNTVPNMILGTPFGHAHFWEHRFLGTPIGHAHFSSQKELKSFFKPKKYFFYSFWIKKLLAPNQPRRRIVKFGEKNYEKK